MRKTIWPILLSGASMLLLFSSCVPTKKYQDVEFERNHFRDENESLRASNEEKNQLEADLRFTETQLRQSTRELEVLTVRCERLKSQDSLLLAQYDKLLEQNKALLKVSSTEKQILEAEKSSAESELDKNLLQLEGMEYSLNERDSDFQSLRMNQQQLEQQVKELQILLQKKDVQMGQLKENLNKTLFDFSTSDLSVTEKNGRIHVSLSQNLLFKSGSDQIDWKGRKAVRQLAGVLKNNPDLDITVEGHTDNTGKADLNWDLSVKRATAVVKELTKSGVDPKRITASGRALYHPVAPNDTKQNQAKNRRTEIILSPNLDKLYEIIR